MQTVTPIEQLQQVEILVREEFKEKTPSEIEVKEFLEKKKDDPTMDAGLSVAIVLALKFAPTVISLIVAGFKLGFFRPKCPVCGNPQVTINNETGKSVCKNGHHWIP
jgi:hypothetical protein